MREAWKRVFEGLSALDGFRGDAEAEQRVGRIVEHVTRIAAAAHSLILPVLQDGDYALLGALTAPLPIELVGISLDWSDQDGVLVPPVVFALHDIEDHGVISSAVERAAWMLGAREQGGIHRQAIPKEALPRLTGLTYRTDAGLKIGYTRRLGDPPLPDAWPHRFEALDPPERGEVFAARYARWKLALPRIVARDLTSYLGTRGLYRLTRAAGRLIYFTSMALPAPFQTEGAEPFVGLGKVYRRAIVIDDTGDDWQAHYSQFGRRLHGIEDDLSDP